MCSEVLNLAGPSLDSRAGDQITRRYKTQQNDRESLYEKCFPKIVSLHSLRVERL